MFDTARRNKVCVIFFVERGHVKVAPDVNFRVPFLMTYPEATRRSEALGSIGVDSVSPDVLIRSIKAADLSEVIAIDAEATGIEKVNYWRELFRHYGSKRKQRFFLVAEVGGAIRGFVIGEVRHWEFGAPSSGWVFGIAVSNKMRQGGIGSTLLGAIFECFRRAGVEKVHTLTGWNNSLMLSFFRSQGMAAAPVITLEFDLR